MNLTLCKVGDTKIQRKQLLQVALEHRIDYISLVKYKNKQSCKEIKLYSVVCNLIVARLVLFSNYCGMIQISNYVNAIRNHLQEIWGIEEQIKSSQGSKHINPDEGHSREQVTEFWQQASGMERKRVGKQEMGLVHLDFDLIISILSVLPCF